MREKEDPKTDGLSIFRGTGSLREYRSNNDWAPVEFMFYYAERKLRAVAYIRRSDGTDIPDGEYEMLDELGERRSKWTKFNGKWQVKWRHSWGQKA